MSASAGVFLLLPALCELDADGLLRALAGAVGEEILRLAVLIRGHGRPADEAAGDPGLLLAAGVDQIPPGALETAPDQDGSALLLRRLVELGRVQGAALAAETAPLPEGRGVLLLRDLDTDAWAYAAPADDLAGALDAGLGLITAVTGHRPELLPTSGVRERVGPERLALAAAQVLDADRAEAAQRFQSWRRRARSAAADLAAMSPPGLPVADFCGVLTAHAVVRGFAARLPGFDRSGIAYLRDTFLNGSGAIRIDGPAVEVELPRSPLRIVLELAGVDRQSLAVPWLPGRQLTLRLPEP